MNGQNIFLSLFTYNSTWNRIDFRVWIMYEIITRGIQRRRGNNKIRRWSVVKSFRKNWLQERKVLTKVFEKYGIVRYCVLTTIRMFLYYYPCGPCSVGQNRRNLPARGTSNEPKRLRKGQAVTSWPKKRRTRYQAISAWLQDPRANLTFPGKHHSEPRT